VEELKELIKEYRRKRPQIKKRLKDFRAILKENDRRIFEELCFCILTPQSKALNCDRAIRELAGKDLLYTGRAAEIRKILRRSVRFHNNKAAYIVGARKPFLRVGIKEMLKTRSAVDVREWLVKNIKGLGYKEAGHFLRNIGLGGDIAILDRHIMKNLKRCGAIRRLPPSLTRKNYLFTEEKMKEFCRKIGIPMEELDLLLWSRETGVIFK
jgi:N-glycosylase/DNA lyase